MTGPRDVVEAWIVGDIAFSELPDRMSLTPRQAERMRKAAVEAALQAHRRILDRRDLWAIMAFGRTTDDLTEEVVRLWATGGTSAAAACEIVGTTPDRLQALADRLGIAVTRTDGRPQ